MILAGIDLAWTRHNPTAIAFGELKNNQLKVIDISHGIMSPEYIREEINRKFSNKQSVTGISIDAPLIITNKTGMRECEKEIGRVFGSRKASCMPSNLSNHPNHPALELSQALLVEGFQHLATESKWQIECYPHPAIINIFQLQERLKYKNKKGMKVVDQIHGQHRLGILLRSLESSPAIQLKIANHVQVAHFKFDQEYNLSGTALKAHEDKLDAIICLYVAALHAKGQTDIFGTCSDGYIVVPKEQSYSGESKTNDWEMAPWAVETAHKYYLAAVQTYRICGGVSMTNAALAIEIILKSYLLNPSSNIGRLDQRYERPNVSGDGHDLSNLLDMLPICIQRRLVPSAFDREMICKYRHYFKESRYAYEKDARSGYSGTLHSIVEHMIRETVKIYRERACKDPWILAFEK